MSPPPGTALGDGDTGKASPTRGHSSSLRYTDSATTPATKEQTNKQKKSSINQSPAVTPEKCLPALPVLPTALSSPRSLPVLAATAPGRLEGRHDLRSSAHGDNIGLPQHRKSTLIPRRLPSMAPRHGTHTHTRTQNSTGNAWEWRVGSDTDLGDGSGCCSFL